jgi:site-specific recombinase XerD
MIYKRGRIWHYDFQQNGKRYKGSCRATNKAEALRFEAEHRAGTRGHTSRRAADSRFNDVFGRFLDWSSSHVKPKTHQRYRVSGKRLGIHFEYKNFAEICDGRGGQTIHAFTEQRRKECSNAGSNRDLACLRTFLNWCQRNGYLDKVPYIKLLPEDSHIIRSVSPEEEAQYMQRADLELRKVAMLILETGMRPDEVFNPSTQWHEDYVYVTEGKTKYARRTVPLTARAKAVLALGLPKISHQVAMRRHKQLAPGFRLYDFRHTFGTRMAMAGVDLMTLRELMGHSSITITQRYCHPTPEHKLAAIRKMEAATPKSTPAVSEQIQ